MKKYLKSFISALAMVGLSLVSPSLAVAMTVQPVVVDLKTAGNGMTQVINVENTFVSPLPVEMRIQKLNITSEGTQISPEETQDLLVFPPQALIQPGQTQAFRVQYVGEPLTESKHYYVTVAQLPVALPEGQSAIQVLYNFQVLVSVAPDGVKPQISVQNSVIAHNEQGKPIAQVNLENTSAAHGYLSSGSLRIIQKDASGHEVFRKTLSGPEIQQTIGFGLVGAHLTRKVNVPVELPLDGGSVETTFTPDR